MKCFKIDKRCFDNETKAGVALFLLSWICPLFASIFYCIVLILPNWESTEFNFDKLIKNDSKFVLFQKLYDDKQNIVGIRLNHINNTGKNLCLMNMQGGIWEICDFMTDSVRDTSSCHLYDLFKSKKKCFNYLTNAKDFVTDSLKYGDKNLYFIKMQNNVISCAIMVVICMGFAFSLSIISIGFQLVICGMVSAVLYAMAALFSVFASAIQNEKVKLLQTDKYCHNYTPLLFPSDFCPFYKTDSFRASTRWPFYISLMSSILFVISAILWIMATRNLRLRKTKEYI